MRVRITYLKNMEKFDLKVRLKTLTCHWKEHVLHPGQAATFMSVPGSLKVTKA